MSRYHAEIMKEGGHEAVEAIPETLNPQSPIPLYRQLADILSAKIRSGEYSVASRIPSENDLAASYNIGRPTARQATEYLIRRGLLFRKRGSGTFVRARTDDVDLFSLGGTLSAFQKKGIDVKTQIHEGVKRIRLPEMPGHPFSGKESFFLSRISSVEGRPLLLEEMFLNVSTFPGMEAMELTGKSISRIVAENYYMHPSGGKQTFHVGSPGSVRAQQLGIDPESKLLVVKRFLHFPRKENAIYAELFCMTDHFVFSQTLGGVLNENQGLF